jgi:hypothetical protein
MAETIKVDRNVCPRCGGHTKSAWFYNGNVQLVPANQSLGFLVASTPCDAYVCMTCGHVEIFARTLEPFYKK